MLNITAAIERASPFFSFIIGLGIAALLFHRKYESVRKLGIPIQEATEKVVKVDGKCYRYRVEDATCQSSL